MVHAPINSTMLGCGFALKRDIQLSLGRVAPGSESECESVLYVSEHMSESVYVCSGECEGCSESE
mgnify:FL=1